MKPSSRSKAARTAAARPRRDPAAELRAAGLVSTRPRRAIWSALAERDDHPTADDVFDALGGPDSGISRTTVYRTLEALVDAGLAQRVGHPGIAVRYDPRTTAHHHFVCDACGAVRDLEPGRLEPHGALEDIGRRAEELGGYDVRELSVLLRGICPRCRDSQTRRRPSASSKLGP